MNRKNVSLIEKYIDGDLLHEEQAALTAQIETSPALMAELKIQKYMIGALKTQDRLEAKKQFRQMLKEVQEKQKKSMLLKENEQRGKKRKMTFWHKTLSIAATLTLLIGMWSVFNFTNSTDALYASYYEPYTGVSMMRGDAESLVVDAMYQYEQEAYEIAAQKLEQLKQTRPNNATLLIFLGNSYLNIYETNQAINCFIKAKQFGTGSTAQTAEWYLTLAYVQGGNVADAITHAKKIQNSKSIFEAEAARLLKDLEK